MRYYVFSFVSFVEHRLQDVHDGLRVLRRDVVLAPWRARNRIILHYTIICYNTIIRIRLNNSIVYWHLGARGNRRAEVKPYAMR